MLKHIEIKNYKTHRLTKMDLGGITLLIGNNNSGKSNLLGALGHLCLFIRRARPFTDKEIPSGYNPMQIDNRDFYYHRHKLSDPHEPMSFLVNWNNDQGEIEYFLELYPDDKFVNGVGCKERIIINFSKNSTKKYESGFDKGTDKLTLRNQIDTENRFEKREKQICNTFFTDIASTYGYYIQPSFIKNIERISVKNHEEFNVRRIASQLGYEGSNFQELIVLIREKDNQLFQRFIASLRRFESSFHGIDYDEKGHRLFWQFDIKGNLQGFPTNSVSDGLVKAAVISLLTSLPAPPALILLEEIENGINPGNIQEFIRWIWRATSQRGYIRGSQFILTSHSPTVLREFNESLDNVYTVRLDRKTFYSDVRNLNTALDSLIGIGTVEGEIIEEEGKRIVRIPRYELAELWYSGTIG